MVFYLFLVEFFIWWEVKLMIIKKTKSMSLRNKRKIRRRREGGGRMRVW